MLSVEIHRDLTRYRAKVVGGLTARSLACTAAALLAGVAAYAALVLALGLPFDEASVAIYACTLPLWALGFWEPQGMRPERWLPLWLRHRSTRARLAYGTRDRYLRALAGTDASATTTTTTSTATTTATTTATEGGRRDTSDAYTRFCRHRRGIERWEPGRDD